jgi:hypothetical protein
VIASLSASTNVVFADILFKSTFNSVVSIASHPFAFKSNDIVHATISIQSHAVDIHQVAKSKSVVQSLEKYHLESDASYLRYGLFQSALKA